MVDATPFDIKLFSKVVFMKRGKRFGLSAEQKIDVWRRWKAGQTLHEIGRAFGKDHNSIRGVVARHGGIVPAVRRRALLALTLREREEISRGLASSSSLREIARCLQRPVSTVSREVARHGGCPAYRASQADDEAWQSALRPKRCLLSINLKLRNIVPLPDVNVYEQVLVDVSGLTVSLFTCCCAEAAAGAGLIDLNPSSIFWSSGSGVESSSSWAC
jgi:hypothetical protein